MIYAIWEVYMPLLIVGSVFYIDFYPLVKDILIEPIAHLIVFYCFQILNRSQSLNLSHFSGRWNHVGDAAFGTSTLVIYTT